WLSESVALGLVMAVVSEVLALSRGEREAVAALARWLGSQCGAVVISVGAEGGVLQVGFAAQPADAGWPDAVVAIHALSQVRGAGGWAGGGVLVRGGLLRGGGWGPAAGRWVRGRRAGSWGGRRRRVTNGGFIGFRRWWGRW